MLRLHPSGRSVTLVGAIACVAVLFGCSSTRTKSLSEALPHEMFTRVYVLIGHQQLDTTIVAKIVDGMKSELGRRFKPLGISIDGQSIVRTNEKLELVDSTEMDHESIAAFAPDGLLTIELAEIGSEVRRLPGVTHVRDLMYAVEFASVASAKIIWRGQVSNKGYGQVGSGWREMGERTAGQIVDQLLADKIIARLRKQPNPIG